MCFTIACEIKTHHHKEVGLIITINLILAKGNDYIWNFCICSSFFRLLVQP
jgi:hypothetical protein